MKNIEQLILGFACVVPLLIYILKLRKFKLSTKLIVSIAVFASISIMLSNITFLKMPQGGSIGLLPSLPIMLIALIYGKMAGVTTGLIYGILSLIGGFIVHPAQVLLDYILPSMILGLCNMFNTNKVLATTGGNNTEVGNKINSKLLLFIGAIIAVTISVLFHVLSGYVFFKEYAGDMNPLTYSLVYNFSSSGVEGLLSSIALTLMPIGVLKRISR